MSTWCSCEAAGGAAPVADSALVDTRWVLRTLAGETIAPGEKPPFLQLDASDGSLRAFGDSGCNRFSGGCVVDGSDLQLGPLAVTRMACPDPAMQLESRFLARLGEARRYEIRSTWLVLEGPDGELATFEAWYE